MSINGPFLLEELMSLEVTVLKFGGSSVAEVAHWQTIADQISNQLENGSRPVLVLSALKNVSNQLEQLLHYSTSGDFQQPIERLKKRHIDFSNELGLNIHKQLQPWFSLLEKVCLLISKKQSITPKHHAEALAIGELLSTTIGAAYLKEKGYEAVWHDARSLLKGKSSNDPWHHYTSNECDYSNKPALGKQLFEGLSNNSVVVTQGFIAADQFGDTILLGREGSDTSAAYLSSILGANRLEIWTDVTGVFSANPKQTANAKVLSKLSYREAYVMAQFGAKVLHPRVIQPAREANIPIQVKSTCEPDHQGTRIDVQGNQSKLIKAIVSETDISCFRLNSEHANLLEPIEQLLSGLGFDTLFAKTDVQNAYLVMKYQNSDCSKPSEKQLYSAIASNKELRELNDQNLVIKSTLGLISVIGEVKRTEWLSSVYQLIDNSDNASLERFESENHERISFCCPTAKVEETVNHFHRQLIE